MKQETSLTNNSGKAPKGAAIAGIAFSLLLSISLAIILISLPANLSNNGAWLSIEGNKLLLALNLIPFAGIAFLWFIGVVRDRLGVSEDRFISTVFLVVGFYFWPCCSCWQR